MADISNNTNYFKMKFVDVLLNHTNNSIYEALQINIVIAIPPLVCIPERSSSVPLPVRVLHNPARPCDRRVTLDSASSVRPVSGRAVSISGTETANRFRCNG